ncbi:MAG: DUF5071 domain-containing protein [Tepidibacter sp.]|uniref:DUF5071 domain-containing protein n=1 Tax=Tepidibacter sp. TaxID=2529387 RepID=UPI0025F3F8C2|nr:DUF5071 domain-containing protein [Tepidibacter sp.]MCT4509582.1 DUF5071 domain-containing protein [Tepidibacter sp.]
MLLIDKEKVELLLQPIDKCYWENSAIVLNKIGYPHNKLAISGLLEWLQDMNWPGAMTARKTLMNIDKKILIPYIEDSLSKAKNENDTIWITEIKELVEDMNISEIDFLNENIYEIISLSEW